jgi:peptidoglycan/xylan/chitin deacetylase (PgdA/CDA1 family)
MDVLASWDDGSTTDLKMAELMAKYNIPTIFYWPSLLKHAKNMAMTSSFLSDTECKEIASRFEIGSHSASHRPLSKVSIPQLGMEITDSRKHWQDFTGQEIESFAYPKNSLNSLTKALIKGAGYKSARTNITGCLSRQEGFEMKCTVQIGIDRIEYENKSWELFAKEMIAKVEENSIFHIFGNSWDVESYNDWEHLEDLIKALKDM